MCLELTILNCDVKIREKSHVKCSYHTKNYIFLSKCSTTENISPFIYLSTSFYCLLMYQTLYQAFRYKNKCEILSAFKASSV